MRQAIRDPQRIGDVAAYKAELAGTRGYPEIEAQLDSVRGFHPRLDLERLASLPSGTFGRTFAEFMGRNRLVQIVPSDAIDLELRRRNAFTLRYAAIHDMVHVLLDFPTDWPGEVGVWAFVGAQRWSRAFDWAGRMALWVAPFRCPLRLGEAWRSHRRGRRLAAGAEMLLAYKLEDMLDRPLDEVRRELGIDLTA
jgi:ubiquinone biosynthesis protein Coq4